LQPMIICHHDTAVVVLSYNGKALHEVFFPELIAEGNGKYDVVLIDNASTDGTLEYVQQNFPTVKTIRLEVNRGFANGYFEGLKQVNAKYYVLLSADFEITPNWYQPLYDLMESAPLIGACQPKIKYYKDKTLFEYAGAGGGFMDKWGYMFCRGRIFFTIEKDEQQYDDTVEVFWAGGGCCFVRAELYHRVGGLDTDLYAHMEEIDLCWRMINSGSTIAYCGASTVYHIGGSVISYGSPAKLFYNYRNNLALLVKNVPLSRLWWLLPWRLILDGVAGVRALFARDFKEIRAILKAHGNFYKTFPNWWKKRNLNGPLPDTMKTYGAVFKRSIIVQYFGKGRKKFTELPLTLTKTAKPE
jgi:GT2 family glycosyltransferase